MPDLSQLDTSEISNAFLNKYEFCYTEIKAHLEAHGQNYLADLLSPIKVDTPDRSHVSADGGLIISTGDIGSDDEGQVALSTGDIENIAAFLEEHPLPSLSSPRP